MGAWVLYSEEELAWLKKNATLPRKKAHEKFCKKFSRPEVTADQIKSLYSRQKWKTGRTGCFPKGHVPDNKGKKMPFNAARARTQFKKGQVPPNRKHLGHERISKDGYVEISIAETNPHTGHGRRYVLKHRHEWEKINGPVPRGMMLKCIDGNRLNTDPSNWKLLSRGIAPLINGRHGPRYEDMPDELKPTMLATAELKHALFKKKREAVKQQVRDKNKKKKADIDE